MRPELSGPLTRRKGDRSPGTFEFLALVEELYLGVNQHHHQFRAMKRGSLVILQHDNTPKGENSDRPDLELRPLGGIPDGSALGGVYWAAGAAAIVAIVVLTRHSASRRRISSTTLASSTS